MVLVRLTDQEMLQGALAGVLRHLDALSWGCKPRDGQTCNFWDANIMGALGELAAAKALGIYCGLDSGTFKSKTDLEGFEVRTSQYHNGHLLVTTRDDPDRKYLLVTGTGPEFRVHGWILGRNARQPRWWGCGNTKRPPCWWVPQEELKPIRGGVGNGEDFGR